VQAIYDAKSEEIGPGIYRFKAEIGNLPFPSLPSPPQAVPLCLAPPLPTLCSAERDTQGFCLFLQYLIIDREHSGLHGGLLFASSDAIPSIM